MPSFNLHFLLFLPVYPSLVQAQDAVQTLFPAAIPLAVKTPYIHVWHESTNTSAPLSFSSQHFWDLQVSLPSSITWDWHTQERREQANMGWAGKIRVNGTMYRWMGGDDNGTPTNVTNIQITPTRSIFVMQAGPVNLTVTFLSPVEVRRASTSIVCRLSDHSCVSLARRLDQAVDSIFLRICGSSVP